MNDVYSIRHADQRAIKSADQVELKAISAGSAVPDVGIIDEAISGELADLDSDGAEKEDWHTQDIQIEDEVGAIKDEIERRAQMLGDSYPFEVSQGNITYSGQKSGFYEYCLAISNTSNAITKKPYTTLPRTFERFVGQLLQRHMGPKWEHLHTGWPRDQGQPRRLDAMFQNLSSVSCDNREWKWNPEEGFPPENNRGGDGGVDFVVWRRSPDGRLGQVFVVGQCACGNDWDAKFNDLHVDKLSVWMRPFTYVPIIRCFTTPFMLSAGNFLNAHKQAGWVLDRTRLAVMADEAVVEADFVHSNALRELFDLATAA